MIKSHVREMAESRGIENAYNLSLALSVSTRTGAKLWNQEFDQIQLATLNGLCQLFGCQPGDLLTYEPAQSSSRKRRKPSQSIGKK